VYAFKSVAEQMLGILLGKRVESSSVLETEARVEAIADGTYGTHGTYVPRVFHPISPMSPIGPIHGSSWRAALSPKRQYSYTLSFS
jgi:hypothetical protein